MLKGIIIAYCIIAVAAYIAISVGVGILIESQYYWLPEKLRPNLTIWKVALMSVFWPVLLLILILQVIIELIKALIKSLKHKED